ncbi:MULTISPECIES: hypothetical protein [Candidatus Ichthyocystis]|uniref:hypothetical protein n=1 Tax=Candidatus Ichthyocystis TaxID=2929841 RepID=UPI000B89009D|nr:MULTISPECIES: hypothetical protein [Ichthyocystis]
MKRKLSITSSEPSSPSGGDVRDGVSEQVQPSSSLEQVTDSSDKCVRLTPSLAQVLGMNPGEALVRGMFHGTPMAGVVSSLVDKMLKAHEGLIKGLALGRGTIRLGDDLDEDGFMRSNESLIEALMDSVEAPAVVAHSGATPAAGSGFVLESRLARELGMQCGEMIFRGSFYGTPQVFLVSGLVDRLLREQEELASRALSGEGTSSAAQSGDGGAIRALMDSNAVTIRALLSSMEGPLPAVASEVIEISSDEESVEVLEVGEMEECSTGAHEESGKASDRVMEDIVVTEVSLDEELAEVLEGGGIAECSTGVHEESGKESDREVEDTGVTGRRELKERKMAARMKAFAAMEERVRVIDVAAMLENIEKSNRTIQERRRERIESSREKREAAKAEKKKAKLARELEERLAELAEEERARVERAVRVARSEERMVAQALVQARALEEVPEVVEEVVAAAREEAGESAEERSRWEAALCDGSGLKMKIKKKYRSSDG